MFDRKVPLSLANVIDEIEAVTIATILCQSRKMKELNGAVLFF